MKLAGARVALDAARAAPADLVIRRGRIFFDARAADDGCALDLRGCLILPGLINAHDHLEFNLFPRLGRGPYPNAAAWARDIYRPDREPIRRHLRVPKPARLLWGGLKNLISGVTTVAHHNPYEPPVFDNGFPVRVVKQFGWAHSLDFSPDLRERYRATPQRWPFIVHAAEGTDQRARDEICRLYRSGVLGPRTVLVHAVPADRPALDLIQRRRASVIWCPSSNRFTLGRTLPSAFLRSGVPVALGTDSALTGRGDLIDEIRLANVRQLQLTDIYAMVTHQAARLLRLRGGAGTIQQGARADLVIVRDRGQSPAEALSGLRPELVLVGGTVKLASPRLAAQLPKALAEWLNPIEVEERGRYLVAAGTRALFTETAAILGDDVRLAGRSVRA